VPKLKKACRDDKPLICWYSVFHE